MCGGFHYGVVGLQKEMAWISPYPDNPAGQSLERRRLGIRVSGTEASRIHDACFLLVLAE